MLPNPGKAFAQDVSDYIWMLENKPPEDDVYSNDLTDWIFTFSTLGQDNGTEGDALAHAIAKWRQASSLQWLVAAIAGIPPSDPNASALHQSSGCCQARLTGLCHCYLPFCSPPDRTERDR